MTNDKTQVNENSTELFVVDETVFISIELLEDSFVLIGHPQCFEEILLELLVLLLVLILKWTSTSE